jgi:hypothetical protein
LQGSGAGVAHIAVECLTLGLAATSCEPRRLPQRTRARQGDGVKVSRLLLIDTANDTSGAWLPHLAAGRFACGDQSGRTSALAGVTKIPDPSRAGHVVCPTDFWFSL